jgi:uncharacterized protein YqeY
MTLNDKLNDEWKIAMRDKNVLRRETLAGLRAAVKKAEIDSRGSEKPFDASDDAQIQAAIEREAKKRRDAIEEYGKVNREDRADAERAELAILQEFLPQPLSSEELEALVREAIAESGASKMSDMGAVMKLLVPRTSGRADGKQVNNLVRAALGA